MGESLLQPMHLLLIFGIALLVFGPKNLPQLGKGLGEAIRGFKTSLADGEKAPAATKPPTAANDAAVGNAQQPSWEVLPIDPAHVRARNSSTGDTERAV